MVVLMADSVEHPMVANWPSDVGDSPSIDARWMLWGVVVAVMVLDVATTAIGLELGLQEGNGLVRVAVGSFGVAGLLVLKGVVLAAAAGVAVSVPDRVSPVIPLGLALPTTIAVAVNLALVGMV